VDEVEEFLLGEEIRTSRKEEHLLIVWPYCLQIWKYPKYGREGQLLGDENGPPFCGTKYLLVLLLDGCQKLWEMEPE
jgi:hypothetical protein